MDAAGSLLSPATPGLGPQVGAMVLRKALDQQLSTASQLLQVLPSPPPSLEAHLGSSINRYA